MTELSPLPSKQVTKVLRKLKQAAFFHTSLVTRGIIGIEIPHIIHFKGVLQFSNNLHDSICFVSLTTYSCKPSFRVGVTSMICYILFSTNLNNDFAIKFLLNLLQKNENNFVCQYNQSLEDSHLASLSGEVATADIITLGAL